MQLLIHKTHKNAQTIVETRNNDDAWHLGIPQPIATIFEIQQEFELTHVSLEPSNGT
jgi:hypothetical protein